MVTGSHIPFDRNGIKISRRSGELLTALGAEVIPVGRSERFVPVDTENISPEQLAELRALAPPGVDALVSTDGDSDRPLMIAFAPDGSARFLPGDLPATSGIAASTWS